METENYFFIEDVTIYPENCKDFLKFLCTEYYTDACYFVDRKLLIKTTDDYEKVNDKIKAVRAKYRKGVHKLLKNYSYKVFDEHKVLVEYPDTLPNQYLELKDLFNYLKSLKIHTVDKTIEEKQLCLF